MNSIIPSFISKETTKPEPHETVIHHYHKIEIIIPKQSKLSFEKAPPTRIAVIKNIASDLLICLGSVMGLLAGAALALQSAGVCYPAITVLANLLMPSVAAILAGSHLSKEDLKGKTDFKLNNTGLPGLTFAAN